jgi:hypothetical protein
MMQSSVVEASQNGGGARVGFRMVILNHARSAAPAATIMVNIAGREGRRDTDSHVHSRLAMAEGV